MISTNLEKSIVDCLKSLNTEKIILFGSMAYGNPSKNSDIDLLIITSDNHTPSSYKEYVHLKRDYSKALSPIRDEYAIDMILHTLPMHSKFMELGSSFAKEIAAKGKVIYERNNQAMA